MFSLKKTIPVIAAVALVAALPTVVLAQTTWNTSKIDKYNGYDYELWNQENKGNVSMKLTGDNGTGAGAVGGTFEATWSNTINVLFRSGRKFTNGNTSGNSGQTHTQIGNISINFAATWSSSDNVKMLGIYGWAFYAPGSVPTKQENGTSSSFSNQIEYYIIQDRGSYNAASSGTNAKKYGSATIDGIAYDFYVCDRIGQAMLTGNGNFKQYFSVPQSTGSHRQSGTVSVSKHFEEWAKVGMKMDGPLYEAAMKVESYTGSSANSNGSAKVTKNILTIGDPVPSGNFTLTVTASPTAGGTVSRSPNSDSYAPNASVSVSAAAKTGYKFDGWSGDASGTANPLSVTMNANKTITAKFTMTADDTTNLVKDGKFPGSSLTSNWTLNQGQYYDSSAATATVSGGKAAINVTKVGKKGDPWNPQLIQQGIPLDNGTKYRLTFDAQASVARELQVLLQRPDSPYTTYAEKKVNLTTASQTVTLEFEMTAASNANGQLAFNMGQATGTVTLSNVRLIRIVALSDDNPTGVAARRAASSPAKPLLRAAPTPSGVKVSFKASESGAATLRLYSLKGDVLSTAGLQTVSGKSYTHTLKADGRLPSGLYMVELRRGGGAAARTTILAP